MKNRFVLFFALALFVGLGSSCSDPGKKGAWSENVKAEYLAACNKEEVKELTADVMKKICDCSLVKLEAEFDPRDLDKEASQSGIEEIGKSCAMEVILGGH